MSRINLTVNGQARSLDVEPRRLLADVLRHDLELSGVHIGCAHGACGCCTVDIDGSPQLSCLTFAVQCDGARIRTVESLSGPAGDLSAFAASLAPSEDHFATADYRRALLVELAQRAIATACARARENR